VTAHKTIPRYAPAAPGVGDFAAAQFDVELQAPSVKGRGGQSPRFDPKFSRDTLHCFETCSANAELRIWFCFHSMSGEVPADLDVGRELIVRPQTVKAIEEGFEGVVGRHHQSLEPARDIKR